MTFLKIKWFICTKLIFEAIWFLNSRYFYFQQFAVISCFYHCHETLIKIVRVEKINLRVRDNVFNLNDVDKVILEYLTRLVNNFCAQKKLQAFFFLLRSLDWIDVFHDWKDFIVFNFFHEFWLFLKLSLFAALAFLTNWARFAL